MSPRIGTLICCILLASTLAFTQGLPGADPPRAPQGIIAFVLLDDVVNQAQTAAYPGTPTPYPNPAADAVLVSYFTTLLDNPAVSGLATAVPWSFLNPNDPGPDPFRPAPDAYIWNSLDDVFIAVSQWNRTHSGQTPKIIQLLPNAGFNAPGWVFTNIDKSVCGGRANCTGSCDGLFMTPLPPVSSHCGYTTILYKTESPPIR